MRSGVALLVVVMVAFASAALVSGCNNNPVIVAPRSLDHAGHIAFVCLDRLQFELMHPIVDLDLCNGVVYTDDQLMAGDELPQYTLHALVTQEARGEVASVDLVSDVVLDSQALVPGYTFGAIGELPSAIVVQEENPEYVFVASPGQLSIVARSIRWFLPESRRGVSEEGRIAASAAIAVPSPVSDLALSPDGTLLYATLPDRGVIWEIPIDPDRTALPFGTTPPREIALSDVVPLSTATPDPTDYCLGCGDEACAGFTDAFAGYTPRDPAALGTAPRPVALTVDKATGLLLVADASLPVVHVLDMTTAGGGMLLESLPLGVPSTVVVVTPLVPRTPGSALADARFLYAIDAIGRTVVAADYAVDQTTRQPSVAVLPVDVRSGRARDRIDVGSGVRTLDVIVTNDYTLDGAGMVDGRTCPSAAGPTYLRGVFLAIGANDGGVHIVDVYDLDAETPGCRFPATCGGDEGWVRRHRHRLSSIDEEGIRLLSPPSFVVGSANYAVELNGETTSDPTFRLEAVPCTGQRSLYGEGVICTLRDPWAVLPEAWAVSYEGLIPGTGGGRGRFVRDGDAWALEGEVPFCERGVLGGLDTAAVSADAPEAGYNGDILVLTAELPPRDPDAMPMGERAECERLFGYGEDLEPAVDLLDFPITRAQNGRLELGPPRFRLPGIESPTSPFFGVGSVEDVVSTCFDELVTYEVRSQNAFTVVGGQTGFLHRVVAEDTEEAACVVDETQPATRFSRAFTGRRFDDGIVTFQILPSTSDGAPVAYPTRASNAVLSFAIGGTPSRSSLPAGAIISDIAYSPADGRLYSADVGGLDGLGQYELTPFARSRTFQ